MKDAEFVFTGNWKKLKLKVSKRQFEKVSKTYLRQATEMNGLVVRRSIRDRINKRMYTPNAELTVLIKESSKPLVDDGDLVNSVTSQLIGELAVFVGILRSARSGDGASLFNLARVLHEGVEIPVTDKMRNLFALLSRAGKGGNVTLTGRAAELAEQLGDRLKDIKPIGKNTKVIVIPPRPFLRMSFESQEVRRKCVKNWTDALRKTFEQTG